MIMNILVNPIIIIKISSINIFFVRNFVNLFESII